MDNIWYVKQGEHVIYIGDRDTAIKVADKIAHLLGSEYIQLDRPRLQPGCYLGRGKCDLGTKYYICTRQFELSAEHMSWSVAYTKYNPFSDKFDTRRNFIEQQLREVLDTDD